MLGKWERIRQRNSIILGLLNFLDSLSDGGEKFWCDHA